MLTMMHYVTETPDGLLHVTNAVGGMIGQHHVHTPESFDGWMGGRPDLGIGPVDPSNIEREAGTCSCGLESGEMRDHLR